MRVYGGANQPLRPLSEGLALQARRKTATTGAGINLEGTKIFGSSPPTGAARASETNWAAASYYFPMSSASKVIASCCLAVLVALYIVGAVSHGSLRHEVQTLPLWFPIVLGFRRREVAKWSALPCLIFWLVIMVIIWLFLLGWARIVTGHFSAIEIAMTLIIGAACIIGLASSFRWRTSLGWLGASMIAVAFAILQLAAFRISLIPYIATR